MLAPYMFHRWRMMTDEFPGSLVVLTRRPDPGRPWLYSAEGMDFPCTSATESIRISNHFAWSRGLGKIVRTVANKPVVHLLEDISGLNALTIMNASRGNAFVLLNDGGFPETTRHPTQRLRWNLVGKRCHGAMSPGEAGRKYMLAWGFPADRIYNSYLSHDTTAFAACRDGRQAVMDRTALRETLGVAPADPLALCVSRLLDWKRLEDLAESLPYLPEHTQSHLSVLLIGDGPHTGPLHALQASTNVRFRWLPGVPYEEMPKYYAASDFMVLPSEGDIWGLAVNEALSMGKPVVCTERIGASELVQDGWNGFKVAVRSPKAIACAIESLVENEELRKAMSNNAMTLEKTWHSGLFINQLRQIVRDLGWER